MSDTGVCRIDNGADIREIEVELENVLEIFYDFVKFDLPFNYTSFAEWEGATGIELSIWEKEQLLEMKVTLERQKVKSSNKNCLDPLLTEEEKAAALNNSFLGFVKGFN